MLAYLESLDPWMIKALAVLASLVVLCAFALLFRRFYHKLTDTYSPE